MKKTAVEWLAENIDNLIPYVNDYSAKKFNELVKQAKEIEKQQQDELAIDFIKWTISQEAEDLIYDLKMVGEVSKFPTTEEVFKVYKRFKNL